VRWVKKQQRAAQWKARKLEKTGKEVLLVVLTPLPINASIISESLQLREKRQRHTVGIYDDTSILPRLKEDRHWHHPDSSLRLLLTDQSDCSI